MISRERRRAELQRAREGEISKWMITFASREPSEPFTPGPRAPIQGDPPPPARPASRRQRPRESRQNAS